MSIENRLPVTLLTGFLGSGKTTALDHLIRDPAAGRIAVIMNEFGQAGLDHDLIEAATEETVLMESGCLCCTLRGDLAQTMLSLLVRRNRGQLDFDRLVIETTGLADPAPIIRILTVDRALATAFRLDGIVAMADAATGSNTLNTQFEAVSQIAVADMVVVTKADLVPPTQLGSFMARLRGLNEHARIVRADFGRLPSGALFNLSAMRLDVDPKGISTWLDGKDLRLDPLANLTGLLKQAGSGALPADSLSHDARISSAVIEVKEPIPADIFDHWLDTLIGMSGSDILRVKGIVHIEEAEHPFVFHGVQHIFDEPVPLTSWSKGDTTSRVVVIARDLDKGSLKEQLNTLRMRPTASPSKTDAGSLLGPM
ncbi:GTP-binding protein [Pseudoruegeria sp. HB172150]|uniref:CobW family GTP-binding protein n=1 Tax=Pseudoruegeria sp. HB172150 TaxID=2721164 RepID=UPI0015577DF0|nr:GTP-binding protein [Pseudoruegeria sp. HB172150]